MMMHDPHIDPHSATHVDDPPARGRRKESADLQRERRRARHASQNLLRPLPIALAIALLIFLLRILSGGSTSNPFNLARAFRGFIPTFLVLLIVAHVLLWVGRRLFHRGSSRRMICARCFQIAPYSGRLTCVCGGRLEDSDLWTSNLCPWCDYDLRGADGACPECGKTLVQRIPIPPADASPPATT